MSKLPYLSSLILSTPFSGLVAVSSAILLGGADAAVELVSRLVVLAALSTWSLPVPIVVPAFPSKRPPLLAPCSVGIGIRSVFVQWVPVVGYLRHGGA